MLNGEKQFCEECRKNTEYEIKNTYYSHCIKGKEYTFKILTAVCKECGKEVNIQGLMDINSKVIDRQYREKEGLVSVEDIKKIMDVYNIGKAPLSLALGFGEITITRYIMGQYPSKEYSNVIRRAAQSPKYMMECLKKNRDKIGETAFKKSWTAAESLCGILESISEKMLITISYIYSRVGEITPLVLQKILYYIQAIYMLNYGEPLFEEVCYAYIQGPIYENVYKAFKDFKYNPMEDDRFIIFKDRFQNISEDEKKIIDMVIDSFGIYSEKTLEKITHNEEPWSEVYEEGIVYEYTKKKISNDAIKSYFNRISKKYNLKNKEGIDKYIQMQLTI
ncbi:type II toxin-antitoxin system antitoxin SocA domain-containing protein [uncultured Eubacterium sp.]|uniref:type II toxin-antitoxin system antitoxin SocA domain-containing protein n=1 Tax=uncultured Eubacterium sp. TaxID=165185 RepID=UPI0025996977|nr:type II toxin-antitoxin system antitoxin SocA domain-containing protein [uncultured Eubacterium sp.]